MANVRADSRNGPSRRATGALASTSGSTSSRAARRFTKVVLARRMKAGSRLSDSASASFWLPSARVVRFAFPTRAASSVRRSASVVTSRELSTRKRSSVGVSRVSSWNSRLVDDSDGLRYLNPSRASAPASRNWRACPLKKPWRARRVFGSSVLKSWSSSTFVLRSGRRDRGAVGELAVLRLGQSQLDEPVRDAGLRQLLDLRARALRQRRVVLVDLERDLGLALVGDPDLLDRPDRRAAQLDEVARHELAAVLEPRVDLVAVAASEDEQRDRDRSRNRCGDSREPCANPPQGRDSTNRPLSGFWGCVKGPFRRLNLARSARASRTDQTAKASTAMPQRVSVQMCTCRHHASSLMPGAV